MSTHGTKTSTPVDSITNQINLKKLLAHINAHTTYPSSFLPMTVQAEPLDLIEWTAAEAEGKKIKTLP